MAAKTGKPRRTRTSASSAGPEPGSIDKLALVRRMIARCSASLEKGGATKSVISDLIRLLALEKELADEESFREINVRWVDPQDTELVA